uniref:Small multi-drug export protein n=1 Tax=Opuntia streptacantha TaxID=393608 RepID=A0A7C9D687_OPUST
MALSIPTTKPLPFSLLHKRSHFPFPSITSNKLLNLNTIPSFALQKGSSFSHRSSHFHIYHLPQSHQPSLRASSIQHSETLISELEAPIFEEKKKPVKTVLWVLFWASVSLAIFAFSKDAKAATATADSSIKASSFGLKIANALRSSGWPDEATVFALATLPVLELRGAIPVGYWMKLKPVALTVLSILGNMVPVPFIVLYLKKLATFLAGKNSAASRLLDALLERAKKLAGPVEEFQWLGLMLFVAVPFPGTGAWTGAIIASVLDMPFWSAVSANFFGVVLAALLVNLLVNLGLKHAIIVGVILFIVSTFMWSMLRSLRQSLSSTN